MAGVNVKMGVTGASEFKRSMADAKAAVKTFDEQLKLNEAQLKLNGNQELYMKNKVEILKNEIDAQKKVVQESTKALQAMEQNGVSKASAAYQRMQQEVLKNSTKLQTLKTDLQNVETGADKAGKEADELGDSLKGIGKGVAWDNVAEGVSKVTTSLQNGARAAINLGKKIAQSAMGSTGWADDILTRAAQYGITPEELQRMENAAAFIDTEVEAIIKSRQKLMKGVGTGSKGTMEALEALGIKYDGDAEKTFWETGKAIMNMADAAEQEAAAQALFGRSWRELIPLFKAGPAEYKKAMENTNVLTDEQVEKLGEADDAIQKIQQQVELMKNQFWADNADKITEMLQWVVDNKDSVVGALTAIAGGFGALKIVEFAANLGKTIEGFKQLGLLGGAGKAVTTAATGAAGASGGGVLSWILKAAPWAAGLYTLLKPGDTASDDLVDKNGNLTEVGKALQEEQKLAAETPKVDLRDDWQLWRDSMVKKYHGDVIAMAALDRGTRYNALQDYWDKTRTGQAGIGPAQLELADIFRKGGMTDAAWDQLADLLDKMTELDPNMEDLPDEFLGFMDTYEERLAQLEEDNKSRSAKENTAGEIDLTGAMSDMAAAAKSGIESANITVVVTPEAMAGFTNSAGKSFGDRLKNFFVP